MSQLRFLVSQRRPDDMSSSIQASVFRAALMGLSLFAFGTMAKHSFAIALSDFDTVAFKWNTGESVHDSDIGVIGTPAPVSEGAINFLSGSPFPIFVTSDLGSDGSFTFGIVNRDKWMPTDGDGKDLASSIDIGDRIYATLHYDGSIQLISAPDNGIGIPIASGTVELEFSKAFVIAVDIERNQASVQYGDEIILEGSPFVDSRTASPGMIADGFAISCTCVCDTGEEETAISFNDIARGKTLISFHEPEFVISESGGSLAIAIDRTQGISAAASVRYKTVAETAEAESDFVSQTGILSWPAGDGVSRYIVLPIRADDLAEGTEKLSLILEEPSEAVAFTGGQTTLSASINIEDHPVDRWRYATFGAMASIPMGGLDGDYDGDSSPNLIERVLGSSVVDSHSQPDVDASVRDGRAAFEFPQPVDLPGVRLDVIASSELSEEEWIRVASVKGLLVAGGSGQNPNTRFLWKTPWRSVDPVSFRLRNALR